MTVESETGLRNAIRSNAVFSTTSGLVCLVAGSWVGEQLGLSESWTTPVRVIGLGLVGYAVALVVIAAAPARRVVAMAVPIVAGDLAWVAVTAVLIAMGSFSTKGSVIAGVVGLIVFDIAVLQSRARRRSLGAVADPPVAFQPSS